MTAKIARKRTAVRKVGTNVARMAENEVELGNYRQYAWDSSLFSGGHDGTSPGRIVEGTWWLHSINVEITCVFFVLFKNSEDFIDMLDSRKELTHDICGEHSTEDHLGYYRLNWKSSHRTSQCRSRIGEDKEKGRVICRSYPLTFLSFNAENWSPKLTAMAGMCRTVWISMIFREH